MLKLCLAYVASIATSVPRPELSPLPSSMKVTSKSLVLLKREADVVTFIAVW